MNVLILANSPAGLYKFRRELLQELLKQHHVSICLPKGRFTEKLRRMGCRYMECRLLDRHGTNPLQELRLLGYYYKLLRKEKPDVVLTYTIKPNIYGGIACSLLGIPYIANITGLGTAIGQGGRMQKLILWLYKKGLAKAWTVFFQNKENLHFFLQKNMLRGRYRLVPGSGVNLKQHVCTEYPAGECPVIFLTIGRLMRDKGTDEILQAAGIIKKRYPDVVFRLIGECEEAQYAEKVRRAAEEGTVEYEGFQPDIRPFIKESHATIHASWHEGMSNVLLETAAGGRPVIASDIPGCAEIFTPGVSGLAFRTKDTDSLVSAIETFLRMPLQEKARMGKMGRKKAEQEFDRNIITAAYLDELQKLAGKRGRKIR